MDDIIAFVEPERVMSPCVLVCQLDRVTGWCRGCGRTATEIAEWPLAVDSRRQAILDALPARLDRLRSRPCSATTGNR